MAIWYSHFNVMESQNTFMFSVFQMYPCCPAKTRDNAPWRNRREHRHRSCSYPSAPSRVTTELSSVTNRCSIAGVSMWIQANRSLERRSEIPPRKTAVLWPLQEVPSLQGSLSVSLVSLLSCTRYQTENSCLTRSCFEEQLHFYKLRVFTNDFFVSF